jgi:predicted site-specific integrase-resolvase
MIERKEIDTIKVGSQIMYNLDKYLKIQNTSLEIKKRICYCRVSSKKQKEDLARQVEYMKNKYPDYDIITDIGSGLNYNRIGLKKILELAINNEIEEIVIAYKDRLTRFGYELIEWIIEKYSGGKITIVNKSEEETPADELTKDITTIMNVYVAKINGLRKYKNKIKQKIKQKIKKN